MHPPAAAQVKVGAGSLRLLVKGRDVMARSRKKTPIRGVTLAVSEREDKRDAHRKERRRVRVRLAVEEEPDVLPHPRDVSNPWTRAKEGKIYLGRRPRPKDLRK
jgi:hypothetical protein